MLRRKEKEEGRGRGREKQGGAHGIFCYYANVEKKIHE